MDDRELIADWLQTLGVNIGAGAGTLSPADLTWRPDALGNGVGVTIWHVARWLDILATRVLVDGPVAKERWHRDGWAARTGYDPTGVGDRELGAITGYTPAEVDAIPTLPAADLLARPPGGLRAPVPGIGAPRPAYDALKPILLGCFAHLGEIAALNAIWTRATAAGAG